MKERVISFGEENNLVGVITEPDPDRANSSLPWVMLLNSGILHHVGPFRLNVVAARRLAAEGFSAFRFDVGGIGDSPTPRAGCYDADRVIADIRAAMDMLARKKGVSEFVFMGLCTGAANAHKVAAVDKRVSGAIFLDGYAYPTFRFYLRRYLPALLDPGRYWNLALRMVRRVVRSGGQSDAATDMAEDFGWWKLPPKKEVEKDLEQFVDRRVNLLYIYSGDQLENYNYREQMARAFPAVDFGEMLEVVINKEADHTYIIGLDRDRLIVEVTAWLKRRYVN